MCLVAAGVFKSIKMAGPFLPDLLDFFSCLSIPAIKNKKIFSLYDIITNVFRAVRDWLVTGLPLSFKGLF